MAKQLIATSELIKWCDEQVAQGKELGMGWEGGGDDGWCYLTIDGKEVSRNTELDYITELIDRMYAQLDYGSWTGDFYASGEAIYNAEEKAFIGIDHYSEDNTYDFEYPIKITVPKSLWFNALEYNIDGDDTPIDVAFVINNGFLTDEHTKIAEEIKLKLTKQIKAAIDAYHKLMHDSEYRGVWQGDTFERSDFVEEGDNIIASIKELQIGINTDTDKSIYLELITQEHEY